MADRTAGLMLAEWRRLLGLTQTEAAKLVPVQQPTWSAWEAEKQAPPTLTAVRLEEVTGGYVHRDTWIAVAKRLKDARAAEPPADDVAIVSVADPRDGVVRFVGADVNEDKGARAWVRELVAAGVAPTIEVLERVPRSLAANATTTWRRKARRKGAQFFDAKAVA